MTTSILDTVRRLYPFAYSVTGEGNDAAVAAFLRELPFTVHEYPSGSVLNGWTIPHPSRVVAASIRKDGRLIYDGTASPLGVIAQSSPFSGRVGLEELRRHLFYSEVDPEAIVYHWTILYRPLEKGWGFCVPKRLFMALEPGEYEVEIVTEVTAGTMKVLDYHLPGKSGRTLLFNAHNCHPFQANDDISGCAVGIHLMQRLREWEERRFGYRLLIAPELIGTVFWLDGLAPEEAATLAGAVMLKSVGNAGELKLQESFTGDSRLDRAAHHLFRHRYGEYVSGPFRTLYGNDEVVFEAPPYEIPSISLTRFPFAAYHTDADRPETLSTESLEDTLEAALGIARTLERDRCLKRCFRGLVSLSHPRYDLYRRAIAPGVERRPHGPEEVRWNLLMNGLPRHLDGKTGLLAVADRYQLPLEAVHEYAMAWVAKGLAAVVEDGEGGLAAVVEGMNSVWPAGG
ncbi:MAG: DUF4910 domain-containing protein [Magnetococcales bacterium]|nr:DUF4910 domain-containing protein [Magnetococcales bacterium]MBF0156118.1 DUF4910 domain-containing protein [Magnetococcales bacterium]